MSWLQMYPREFKLLGAGISGLWEGYAKIANIMHCWKDGVLVRLFQ
jgi:hypothetical protein